MAVWRAQSEYLKWQNDGAPEEILEALRQYIVVAAELQAGAMNENVAAAPGSEVAAPMAPPLADPMAAQPTAALADQAMMLRAS